jgi:hypothetical protein
MGRFLPSRGDHGRSVDTKLSIFYEIWAYFGRFKKKLTKRTKNID